MKDIISFSISQVKLKIDVEAGMWKREEHIISSLAYYA